HLLQMLLVLLQCLQNVGNRSRGGKCELHEVGPYEQGRSHWRGWKNAIGPLPQRKDQRTAQAYAGSPERFSEPQQPRCQNWQRDVESGAGDLDRTVDGDVIGGLHPLAGQVDVSGLPEMTKAKKNQSCYRNEVG